MRFPAFDLLRAFLPELIFFIVPVILHFGARMKRFPGAKNLAFARTKEEVFQQTKKTTANMKTTFRFLAAERDCRGGVSHDRLLLNRV